MHYRNGRRLQQGYLKHFSALTVRYGDYEDGQFTQDSPDTSTTESSTLTETQEKEECTQQ